MLLLLTTALAGQWTIEPRPAWVEPVAAPQVPSVDDAQTVLWDNQVQVQPAWEYCHLRYRVNTDAGVRDWGDLTITYDTSYQRVVLHAVRIQSPNGAVIDVLDRMQWHTTGSEAQPGLYTGLVEMTGFVPGLRPGDEIESEYSIVGDHPVLDELWSGSWFMGWYGASGRRFLKVHSDRPLAVDGPAPVDELTWDSHATTMPYRWGDEPTWYEEEMVTLSAAQDWGEVVDWDLKHYTQPTDARVRNLARGFTGSTREKVTQAVDYVQNDIRYVGLEVGLHGFMPDAPGATLANQFGDCKDKAVLLVALLAELKVSAWPALADITHGAVLDQQLPNAGAFDHVVVLMELEGQELVIDPTIAGQLGPLENRTPINLVQVLPLRKGQDRFVRVPLEQDLPDVEVHQVWDIPRTDPAMLEVTTLYRYGMADTMRATLSKWDMVSYAEELRAFYATDYPDITVSRQPMWTSLPDGSVELTERWSLPDFSVGTEHFVMARDIETYLPLPPDSARQTPVGVLHPFRVKQTLDVHLADPMLIANLEKKVFATPAFTLEVEHLGSGRDYTLVWEYASRADHIAVDDLAQTHSELVAAEEYLGFQFVQSGRGVMAMGVMAIALFIAGGVGVVAAILLVVLLTRRRR